MDTKLFVGMLSKECTDAEVESMFQPFGNVVECAVLRDSKGNSKGCAFVTFEKYDESMAAISALHGSTRMDGCKANIVVKFADTEKQKQQRYSENEQGNNSFSEDMSNREDTKLFIGMIGNTITEEKLQSMFSEYGTITECAVLRDSDGNSRGCGFIRYSTVQESLAAIKGMNGTTKLPGANSNVVVKFADTEKQRQQRLQKSMPARPGAVNPKSMFELDDTKIFVGMLGSMENVDELRNMFKPFGDIVDCAILRDSGSGRSKGCGFVRFATPKEAYQAIRVMNGSEKMPGASANLVVKFADNKKAQQQQQPPPMPPQNYGNQGNMNRMGMGDNTSMMPPPPVLNNSTINQLLQQQLALTAAAMNLTQGGAAPNLANQFANQGNQFGANQFGQNQPNQFGGNNQAPFGNTANQQQPQFGNTGNGQFGNGQGPSNQFGNNSGNANQFGGFKNDYQPYDDLPSNQSNPVQQDGGQNSLQQVLSQMSSPGQQGMNNAGALQQAIAQQQAFIQQALVAQQFNAPSQPPPPQEPGRPGPDGCNLFVMHLPKECADHQLRQLFTPFGNVLSANIFYDKVTNESKCFGFVSFDDATCAQNAIKSMNGFQIGGKRLKVQLKTNKKPY